METRTPSLRSLWRLRLGLGAVVLLGSVICFLGTSWDIQWHSLIGRDRTLIPPHIMMLGGVTLSGTAALSDVLIETIWARRNRLVAERSVPFAGLFNASLGGYVAGFAALDAAVAFPLDAYWHAIYGIDVTIWAPFRVMILGGMAMTALGGAYLLASAAHLAAPTGRARGGPARLPGSGGGVRGRVQHLHAPHAQRARAGGDDRPGWAVDRPLPTACDPAQRIHLRPGGAGRAVAVGRHGRLADQPRLRSGDGRLGPAGDRPPGPGRASAVPRAESRRRPGRNSAAPDAGAGRGHGRRR